MFLYLVFPNNSGNPLASISIIVPEFNPFSLIYNLYLGSTHSYKSKCKFRKKLNRQALLSSGIKIVSKAYS